MHTCAIYGMIAMMAYVCAYSAGRVQSMSEYIYIYMLLSARMYVCVCIYVLHTCAILYMRNEKANVCAHFAEPV